MICLFIYVNINKCGRVICIAVATVPSRRNSTKNSYSSVNCYRFRFRYCKLVVNMDAFAVGSCFDSFDDLKASIASFEKSNFVSLYKRDVGPLKRQKGRA